MFTIASNISRTSNDWRPRGMPGAAAVAVGDVVECEKFPNAWCVL
jgi:hypothetical protein